MEVRKPLPTYKDKDIPVEDHDVDLKIKGEKAAQLGPELADYIKKFSGSNQETLED